MIHHLLILNEYKYTYSILYSTVVLGGSSGSTRLGYPLLFCLLHLRIFLKALTLYCIFEEFGTPFFLATSARVNSFGGVIVHSTPSFTPSPNSSKQRGVCIVAANSERNNKANNINNKQKDKQKQANDSVLCTTLIV